MYFVTALRRLSGLSVEKTFVVLMEMLDGHIDIFSIFHSCI